MPKSLCRIAVEDEVMAVAPQRCPTEPELREVYFQLRKKYHKFDTPGTRPKKGRKWTKAVRMKNTLYFTIRNTLRGAYCTTDDQSKTYFTVSPEIFISTDPLAYTLKVCTPVEDLPVPNAYTKSFVVCS